MSIFDFGVNCPLSLSPLFLTFGVCSLCFCTGLHDVIEMGQHNGYTFQDAVRYNTSTTLKVHDATF